MRERKGKVERRLRDGFGPPLWSTRYHLLLVYSSINPSKSVRAIFLKVAEPSLPEKYFNSTGKNAHQT